MRALVLVPLLLSFPLASGQEVPVPPMPDTYGLVQTGEPTSLYFHLDGDLEFPINTQEPDPAWSTDVTLGSFTSTATCAAPLVGNTGGAETEYHTYRGYASPSYVHYDLLDNGLPRTHPERGIAYDVVLADNAATLYWYAKATQNAPGASLADLAPIPVPNVIVRATLRAADAISIDNNAYDTGELLAQGETEPATLAGDAVLHPSGTHPQVRRVNAGSGYLYEFAVPLEFTGPIPRATGFNVRIDVYADNPACSDPETTGYVMPNVVAASTVDGARPRLDLMPAEPLRLVYLAPQVVGDEQLFHVSIQSAWGQYDVDYQNATVGIFGPSNATSLHLARVNRHTEIYGFQTEALDLTYAWTLGEDDPKPGAYTFVLSIPNLQGTAAMEMSQRFEVGGDVQQELPGPALPLLALGLAAAVALVRRR